nr:MAG TPA: hypothetical protein [Caudoviricetes sp.]
MHINRKKEHTKRYSNVPCNVTKIVTLYYYIYFYMLLYLYK